MAVYAINQKFTAAPLLGADPAPPGQSLPALAGPASPWRRPDAPPSPAVFAIAEMFGIGLDESSEVTVCDNLRLDLRRGDVVFVTGPSGSGKSVLLRALVAALQAAEPRARIVDLAMIAPPADEAVIDGLGLPVAEALRLVSAAGLADAFLLLRRPRNLSDGQQWRLRLAHALARLLDRSGGEATGEGPMPVLVADELASTLDRLCARAVAYRLRRIADERGITILAASAHDDLIEDLAPDVLVVKDPGSRASVRYADPARSKEGER